MDVPEGEFKCYGQQYTCCPNALPYLNDACSGDNFYYVCHDQNYVMGITEDNVECKVTEYIDPFQYIYRHDLAPLIEMTAKIAGKVVCDCANGQGLTSDEGSCPTDGSCTSCDSGYRLTGVSCEKNEDKPDTDEEEISADEVKVDENDAKKDPCFPNGAIFIVDGEEVRADELKVGDLILVGDGKYEEIIEFAHGDVDREDRDLFVELELDGGFKIRATRNHKTHDVYKADISQVLSHIDFADVKVGDMMPVEGLGMVPILSKRTVRDNGNINPIVVGAKAVVNGVIVSTLATPWVKVSKMAVDLLPHSVVRTLVKTFLH